MAITALESKDIGSIVKIPIDGKVWDFIVVQKGKPSELYGDGFNDGVTLLMKDCYENRKWDTGNLSNYANSTIHADLHNIFFNLVAPHVRGKIKEVTLPYRPGSAPGTTINSGTNGLPSKIFLLSGTEIGFSGTKEMAAEGTRFSYFQDTLPATADYKRIANLNGAAVNWWLRSPLATHENHAWHITTVGGSSYAGCTANCGMRPTFVLPSDIQVSDDGTINPKGPAIDGADSDIGTKSAAFTHEYTATDVNLDTVTITELINGKQFREYTANSGQSQAFTVSPEEFAKLGFGLQTLTVIASDMEGFTARRTWTFVRDPAQLGRIHISLASALPAGAMPKRIALKVNTQMPDGAALRVLVSNNANDENPTWEDATGTVVKGNIHVFTNVTKTAADWGINVQVSIDRNGAAGDCCLYSIGGNFE